MRTSFVSTLRCLAATLAIVIGASVINAQAPVYSDNFQTAQPFTSTYTQVANNLINGMQPARTYSVTPDLARDLSGPPGFQTQHPALTGDPNAHRFYDHTFGNVEGLYLAINGDTATSIYGATGIAVIPNTDYVFSVWMNTWTYAGDPPVFGRIDVRILGNNSAIGSIGFVDSPPTTPNYNTWGNVNNWTQTLLAFNSGDNTLIDLDILNVNTQLDGNDYSIDDISIAAIPEPGVIALSGIGAVGFGVAIYSKIRARRRRKMLAQQKKLETASA